MHALDADETFNHSRVPVVMFHPGQNDWTDVTVVPALPVQGLVNRIKRVIVDPLCVALIILNRPVS